MSNTISIEEFNTLQEKLQNTISQTFDYKKQIERLTKELEKEKELKLKDKASAGINSFLNTLKKNNLAEENEKLKAEIELLNDFKVQNEALKNHIHSLTDKYDKEISTLKSEIENYKINDNCQLNSLQEAPKSNLNEFSQNKNGDDLANNRERKQDIINSIEKLKQNYSNNVNNINNIINEIDFSTTIDNKNESNKIDFNIIFRNFKKELKSLLSNYSILQYKDLESEEIGKVILNVNNYLNELKSTSIINISENINNNYVKKNELQNFKNQYKSYYDEFSHLLLEIKDKRQELMDKYNIIQEKLNNEKLDRESEIKDNIEQNNCNEKENNIENNIENKSDKDENDIENHKDDNLNKDKTFIESNKDDNNNLNEDENKSVNSEKNENLLKESNDTQINSDDNNKTIFDNLIQEYNNFIEQLILKFEEMNKKSLVVNEAINDNINTEINNIKDDIETVYNINMNDLVKKYGNENFGLNQIMSKDSVSIKEFNQLYNNKIDFIIEKYEKIYKEETENNQNNLDENNSTINEGLIKLKNDINTIKEKSIKELNDLADHLYHNINDYFNSEKELQIHDKTNESNENKNNIENINDINNIEENDMDSNKSNDLTNIDFEKRLIEAKKEIKQQMENQMVEEKQAFVKSLKAGFENEKLQLEKVLHDEFEIEINRILDEHYSTNKEKDEKIEKLSKENEVMSKELANIKYDLAKSNTKCRQKQEEADNYQKINSNITKELNKVKEELNNFENKLTSEKRVLLDEIDQYKDHIAVIEKAKVDLSKRFDDEFMTKENEINRARQKIDELMRDNYSLEEKFNTKARQTESIQATMLINQEELEQVKENHSKLIEKYENLSSKYSNLLKEFDVSKANCDRNSKNILESQEMVKEYKKKANELSHTNEENIKKMNNLQQLYDNLKNQLEDITKVKNEDEIRLKELSEKSESLSKEIKEISLKNESLIKENKELEDKWHETENELRVSDRKKIQVIKDLQKQLIKERKSLLKSGDSTDSVSTMTSPNPSSYSSPKLYEFPNSSSNNKINQEISDNQSSYSASSSYIRKASKTTEISPISETPPESSLSNSSAKTSKRKLTPEEKVKVLILRNKKLNEELSTKSKILQQYILQEHSAELQPDSVNKPKLFNMSILSNPKLLQKTDPAIVTQINQKLQKLVEELTTKNIILKEELEKIKCSK